MAFQVIGQRNLNRSKRHVWYKRGTEVPDGQIAWDWKCVLCGAVTEQPPPDFAEEEGWTPTHYEPLTPEERELCPLSNKGYRK